MGSRRFRDYGGYHNDYADHGKGFEQKRRVPLSVIGDRLVIVWGILAALIAAWMYGK